MLIHIQVIISAVISYHPSSFCLFETLRPFFLFGGIFLAGVTLSKCRGGTISIEKGNINREHGKYVFPLVFPENVSGTCSWNTLGFPKTHLCGKPSAYTHLGNKGLKIKPCTWFAVGGLGPLAQTVFSFGFCFKVLGFFL